ncbi:GvpL/GvpF family gas vesicle protein [Geodermatophilus sp. SYSU D00815]
MSEELERLARAAAPEVLAAALERAREQAVARLADLLTDAIVAQALAGPVPAAAPEPAPAPPRAPEPRAPEAAAGPEPVTAPEPAAAGGDALYAYGITLAALPLPAAAPALTGAPLERVADDDLALLVSRVTPDQLRVDEDDLSESGRLATLARGHDAVVRAAAGVGPVLPLRFGTVVPDETAARRLLAEHGAAARAQLARIGDTREWGVKLVRRLDAEPVPAGPRPADRVGVSGTEYLARRRQALRRHDETEAAAEQAAELLEETLRPHVAESLRRGGAPGSSLLLDLAFLVPPEAETAFLAAAGELRERLEPDGLEVEVSGPWPPYSFAALEAGGA